MPTANGWNWAVTCDHDFRIEKIRDFEREIIREKERVRDVRTGATGRTWRVGRVYPRPPSLCLLEDVIMPAVGECCTVGGSAEISCERTQSLLSAIDEGISFLREEYSIA